MPIQPLPDHPDLDRMRNTAKDLRDLVRAGVDGAVATVREHRPRGAEVTADPTGFRLADAQLTLARHHGFASWPKLKAHVEMVHELTRSPHEQPVGGPLETDAERADELLRLACLTYGGADDVARHRAALALLAEHPHLSGLTLHTAAATGDVEAARRHLAEGEADPRRRRPRRRALRLGATAVRRLLADRRSRRGPRHHRRGPPPPRPRRRSRRRVPVGRPAVALHRPHRRVRRGRGRPATPRPVARAGRAPPGRRRRPQRQPDDLRPRPRRRHPGRHRLARAAARPRPREGRRRTMDPPARPRGPEPRRGGGRGAGPRRRGRAGRPGAAAPRPRRRSRPGRGPPGVRRADAVPGRRRRREPGDRPAAGRRRGRHHRRRPRPWPSSARCWRPTATPSPPPVRRRSDGSGPSTPTSSPSPPSGADPRPSGSSPPRAGTSATSVV